MVNHSFQVESLLGSLIKKKLCLELNLKFHFPYKISLINHGAKYKQGFLPFTSYVVSDDRIITGQNPQSSKEIAEAVVKRLSTLN